MSLGDFQISTSALLAQSQRINVVSGNVANISTDGFRRSETIFQTLVSDDFTSAGADFTTQPALNSQFDVGGVEAINRTLISEQGQIRATSDDLDVAISGDGFFAISPTLAFSGDISFTRQGDFQISSGPAVDVTDLEGNTLTVNQGFLTVPSGEFLLGVLPDASGAFAAPTLENLSPIQVDEFAFIEDGQSTTVASLGINLPANTTVGTTESFLAEVVDSNFRPQTVSFDFQNSFAGDTIFDFSVGGTEVASATVSPGAPFNLDAGGPGSGQLVDFQSGSNTITIRNNLGSDAVPTAGGPPVPGAFAGLSPGDSITIAGSSFVVPAGTSDPSGALVDDPGTPLVDESLLPVDTTFSNDGTFVIAAVSSDFSTISLEPTTPIPFTQSTFTGVSNGAPVNFTSDTLVTAPLVFGSDGTLDDLAPLSVDVTFTDGATASFTLDLSSTTNFGTSFASNFFTQNGLENAILVDFGIDGEGVVQGSFSDGSTRSLAQIPLATFSNTDALFSPTNQVFFESEVSGAPNFSFVDGIADSVLISSALEGSNVSLEQEFGILIQAQQAFSFATQTFQIQDELLQEVTELGQS